MKKFLSYMKPYVHVLLIAIALLFVQSFAELKLPNYMSQIVDTGIQAGGLKDSLPDKMSENSMRYMLAVLPEEKGNAFVSAFSKDSNYYIYSSSKNKSEYDEYVGRAMWSMINLLEAANLPIQDGASETMESVSSLLPLIEMFETYPNELKVKAYEKALDIEPKMLSQTGNVLGKMFYKDAGYDLDKIQSNYILTAGAKMLGITLIGAIATVLVVFLSARFGSGFARDLRKGVFNNVQDFSSNEFEDFSSSSLVVRTTNDITQVRNLFSFGIRIIVSAPIMAIGGIFMIRQHQTDLSWILLVTVSLLLVIFILIFIFVAPKFKQQQKFVDGLNRIIRENLNGLMVIRAFDNQEFEATRFDDSNAKHADTILYISRIMVLMMPLLMFIMNGTMLAILWFGAQRVSVGLLQIGDMMAFIQYSMQIIMSFLMIAMMFVFVPRAAVSINRINEVLNTDSSIKDPDHPKSFDESKKGTVEFKNVCYKYKDAPECVIENISFIAEKGQTTAFIGSTGSGKSTLIKLIPRFYDATYGEVLVDGVNVKDVTQHDLRQSIGYVPQQSSLLSGTVKSNVIYGKQDASEEEIKQALEISQSDFVFNNEEGLDMNISQSATNISGGQKQRISIARALAKQSDILIFDDSFSALDFKTDLNLRQALKKELKDTTLLIVAQRINTIMDAEQIIVLDEGKIVGKGTHDELLKTCDAYYQIALSQLSEEELIHE